jgi:carbamoyl-phosphate synthase small subunit
VRGFVIEELTEVPSNWRSEMSLDEYLRNGISPAQRNRHARAHATSAHARCDESVPDDRRHFAARSNAKSNQGEGVIGMDYVREVSTKKIYRWDPRTNSARHGRSKNRRTDRQTSLPPIRFRIAAYDYGIKENILRLLRQKGFEVTVVPAGTSAQEVLALDPDGIFLSNGPAIPRRSITHTKRCTI